MGRGVARSKFLGEPRGYFCRFIVKIFTFGIKIVVICKILGGARAPPAPPVATALMGGQVGLCTLVFPREKPLG